MARDGLAQALLLALQEAASKNEPVVRTGVSVKTNGHTELVDLLVQKIDAPKSIEGLLRVSFVPTPLESTNIESPPAKSGKHRSSAVKEIERELQQTRESLQRSNEELDASNEEMKSSNEELQSTNEELQSTNEELETSKEELQSLNEELHTVNAEFQEKNILLAHANDDMTNLLNSSNVATVFLDNQLCIKRYTERATRVIHLIPSDIGRSLSDLTSTLDYKDLVEDSREVLKSLVFKELEVRSETGSWYLVRILPYRTFENTIDGLVLTFVDIDEIKRTQIEAKAARMYAENILSTVRVPLLVLNHALQVRSANRAFYELFDLAEDFVVGKLIYHLGGGQWDFTELRELLEKILPQNTHFDDFEVKWDFTNVGRKHLLLNGRRMKDKGGEPSLILLAMRDVSA
ncbi:MAG: two-component system CheB/CheR fusion protein [Pirellulaceae bacterium]|jgi:two-component system CheB/CheR fusion protein